MFLIFMIISSFIIGCWLSPFLYLPAYLRLWKHLLFDREKAICFRIRLRQAGYLLKHLLVCPLQTFFWYADELLFPGYKRQKIQPVFIVGLPRSGTTFLHRTLGADGDTFLAVRYFEWAYPFLCLLKLFCFIKLEEKLKSHRYWSRKKKEDIGQKMHEMDMFTLEEDASFFDLFFLYGYGVFYRFPYPALLPYLNDFPSLPQEIQRHFMITQQKVIKKILYLRGRDKIYLSKHIDNDVRMQLLRLYPDARFIALFRHPIHDVLSSWIKVYQFSPFDDTGIDLSAIPGWKAGHVNTVKTNTSRLIEQLEQKIDSDKQIRLSFEPMTKNIVSSVRYIYRRLGLDLSDEYLRYLEQIEQAQRTRRRGYDYERQHFEGFEKIEAFILKADQSHRAAINSLKIDN